MNRLGIFHFLACHVCQELRACPGLVERSRSGCASWSVFDLEIAGCADPRHLRTVVESQITTKRFCKYDVQIDWDVDRLTNRSQLRQRQIGHGIECSCAQGLQDSASRGIGMSGINRDFERHILGYVTLLLEFIEEPQKPLIDD